MRHDPSDGLLNREGATAADPSRPCFAGVHSRPQANFLALSHSGDGMSAANNHTQQLRELVDLLNL